MKQKVLVLVSGGLDSLLTVKILQEQAIVEAVYFLLPFSKDKSKKIKDFCKKEKINLEIIDYTKGSLFKEYLDLIKYPKHGRGTALNPCIDCHMFLLRKAKLLADKKKIKIIATGEVLGERPLSQTRRALDLINIKLDFEVLRPLSAKLLAETKYEKSKIINRNKLLAIKGRKRNEQYELARNYNIDFPTPGGGCLLCEKKYCEKLKLILDKEISFKDIELLKIGRHFPGIILGRNEQENQVLEKEQGIKIIPEQPGPTALIKNKEDIKKAKELIRKNSKHKVMGFEVIYK